jgi:xanthine/uracil/vitamin C permease (AzgA family)
LPTLAAIAYAILLTQTIPFVLPILNTLYVNKVWARVNASNSANYSPDLNRSLVTATAAVAGFSSFLFGFLTNMPVALGPGMGLNAYFAYQIVGYHGQGIISYNLALTAVFIEGFVFVFLSLIGMRQCE